MKNKPLEIKHSRVQKGHRARTVAVTAMTAPLLRCAGLQKCPQLPLLDPVTPDDRILILAPHEDDETLGTGGIIQKAISAGAAVRVVYLTYGDHNELAFMVYRKRPWISPGVNEEMGEVRRREAVKAMAHLGLAEDNLVFLGYPDNGTLSIWKKHWGPAPPLHSILTNTTSVPYPDAASYGRPYKGEEIVAAIEQQLLDFRPTRVFVTHPVDGNPDHRSYYLFLQVALLNLGSRLPSPVVVVYPIHMGPWPRPHWFQPDDYLAWPAHLADDRSPAWSFELPPDHVQRKYEAICIYKSQMSDCNYWLTTFARRNELFTAPQTIVLTDESPEAGCHGRAVPTGETAAYEGESPPGHLGGVSYSGAKDGLIARIDLRRPVERDMGVSCYAFGYRRDRPFAEMPKIHVESVLDRLSVHDQHKQILPVPLTVEAASKEITFIIPWELLGHPEIIFAQARGLAGGTPVSRTAWQILSRAPGAGADAT